MGTPWWQGFFDRAYVDTWEADGAFEGTEEEVDQLVTFLRSLPDGARLLDIPCGFGRFSAPLQDAGFEVTGVDLSEDQIQLARERNPGPTYEVGDMREPPPGPFDAVLNLYSSMGYFEDPADDLAALRAWHDVLAPGGLLVIETMHRDRVAWLWRQDFDPGVRKEEGWTDWATGVRTSTVEVAGEQRQFRIRLYTATDLVRMVTAAGFTEVEVFGGLEEAPLDPSRRLALRARRP